VVIPVEDYDKVAALPEAQSRIPETPYSLALNSGFFETIKAVNRNAGKHVVAFVHDGDERFPKY